MADISDQKIDHSKPSISMTVGDFATEDESHQAFYELINGLELFQIFQKKISHQIEWLPRWRNHRETYIPDFVLLPLPKLIDAGWPAGEALIVDAKASGVEIGPVCSQLLDYLCASYMCSEVIVRPSWAFMWPVRKQKSTAASIMSHQRFGTVIDGAIEDSGMRTNEIGFYVGEGCLLRIVDGVPRVSQKVLQYGKRSGSR